MERIIKVQMSPSVFIFPAIGSPPEIFSTKKSRIYFTTGLVEPFINPPTPLESPLNINSKKGISIPIERMEKTIDRMMNKK